MKIPQNIVDRFLPVLEMTANIDVIVQIQLKYVIKQLDVVKVVACMDGWEPIVKSVRISTKLRSNTFYRMFYMQMQFCSCKRKLIYFTITCINHLLSLGIIMLIKVHQDKDST